MNFNYAVTIKPLENNAEFDNISDIGMFNNVITWVTAYSGTYNDTNSSDKVEKWLDLNILILALESLFCFLKIRNVNT